VIYILAMLPELYFELGAITMQRGNK